MYVCLSEPEIGIIFCNNKGVRDSKFQIIGSRRLKVGMGACIQST